MDQEKVIYQARLNKILFVYPILLLFLSIYLWFYFPILHHVGLLFIAVAVVWLIMVWILYSFSFVTIKENRIVIRKGMLMQQTIDVSMSKIESIDIRQSIVGSILGFGDLIITGTGGTKYLIHYINNPLTCRRYIEQMMHSKQ